MRKLAAIITSIGIAVTLAGLFIQFAGESYYREQLPPELRTPEAVRANFDNDAVCMACDIFGGTVALYGIVILLSLAFALTLYAFLNRGRKLD